MRERTLVTHKLYFGMSALHLRTATTRVMARLAGIPPEIARVNSRNLRQDFGMNTVEGEHLVEGFVANGLLEPRTGQQGEYRLTERFLEFAAARVVDPLPRSRARELLAQSCELATRINAECTRNPLEIAMVAPFGRYIGHDEHFSVLELGVVVLPRAPWRRARWGKFLTKSDGARDIRAAFRDLSSFIRVRMVNDKAMLPRPFTVVFEERQ
jgi:hypothetical protein